ncbi:MAG TPA: alpha/beta fold hydrolase [Candidatus Thermoplasmatota archaeon]|nr:alpha/beta fold hydrolase [Candidatus Thermoplasmatota archaeon]
MPEFTPAPLAPFEGGNRNGVPLLLLHAFPLDHTMWQPQLDAGLPARVITPDLRGFGVSYFDDPASIEEHAKDVLAFMDDQEIPRFVVGGLSMGGYIAMAVARLAPERVLGLVLANTRATADTEEARTGRDRTIARLEAEGINSLVETMPPRLLSPRTMETNPAVVAEVRRTIGSASPSGVINALRAMRDRPDASAGLRQVRVPTLVIAGEEDTFTPPEEARRLADLVPGAELVVIPGAAHLSNLENPEAFNAALERFLSNLQWRREGPAPRQPV